MASDGRPLGRQRCTVGSRHRASALPAMGGPRDSDLECLGPRDSGGGDGVGVHYSANANPTSARSDQGAKASRPKNGRPTSSRTSCAAEKAGGGWTPTGSTNTTSSPFRTDHHKCRSVEEPPPCGPTRLADPRATASPLRRQETRGVQLCCKGSAQRSAQRSTRDETERHEWTQTIRKLPERFRGDAC
jgi:hypothetical protein